MTGPLFMKDTAALKKLLRQDVSESKLDMGLLDPLSQAAHDLSLFHAVCEGDVATVRHTLQRGANPNVALDAEEGTLLHCAVRRGVLKVIVTLLQGGADPYATDGQGRTAAALAPATMNGGRIATILRQWEKKRQRPQASGEAAVVIPFPKTASEVA